MQQIVAVEQQFFSNKNVDLEQNYVYSKCLFCVIAGLLFPASLSGNGDTLVDGRNKCVIGRGLVKIVQAQLLKLRVSKGVQNMFFPQQKHHKKEVDG